LFPQVVTTTSVGAECITPIRLSTNMEEVKDSTC